MGNGEKAEPLTILGAITQLKDEIRQAQDDAAKAGELPMFLIEEGELELKLVAKRESKGEGAGKIALKIFSLIDAEASAGGSRTRSSEATHTLKIKFKAPAASTLSPEALKKWLVPSAHVDR